MNKCLRLVVFGGLLSVAALNADDASLDSVAAPAQPVPAAVQAPAVIEPAAPVATTATSITTPATTEVTKIDASTSNASTPPPVAGFSLYPYTSKVSVQAIKDLVNKYPYHFAAGATAVVVGLAVWKCSWVRKQLGLEEDENDLRSDFDFEAMMNQAKRK